MRIPSRSRARRPGDGDRGFTLIELIVTLVVLALVVAALAAVMTNASRSKDRTSQNLEATQTARATVDMLAKDIRCAGYGDDIDAATPQTAIAYVDSMQIILSENLQPFPDTTTASGVARHLSPQAYDPAGAPNPQPLVGTQWTPPVKYGSGAELVRYTLDLNDDGVVNASDQAAPAGADARATPNPNDYVLVREVYGDSTGNIAHNNGGVQERVALVYKPGGGVPPLFNVYMRGSNTPWDWSAGPVPANQLKNIDRVTVQVTASSAKPDNKGRYPSTTLRTQVNSMHNSPLISGSSVEYQVSGYVMDDVHNTGIPGATVQLGTSMIRYTNSAGFYSFTVPAGTYTIRHTPAMGYVSDASPDTAVLVVAGAMTHTFLDKPLDGGYVTIHCYNDANADHVEDAGDSPMALIPVTLGAYSNMTDGNGNVTLFAPTGTWSASATVPDTMTATTPNPVTGSITNGGTASASIGMTQSANGTVSGTVYKDLNRDGQQQGGEAGIPGVWVGVTSDGGVTVLGWATTDASGDFTINVPENDPPHTTAYTVYVVPPTGYFPTEPTAAGNVWVKAGQNTGGFSFGMANYTVITLSANRVLSLAATDLMEKDWPGNATSKARGDVDLILGADAGGTDQVSVWFNRADIGVNPFGAFGSLTADKSWAAPQSVLSIALDTLDANVAPFNRPDLVTGTRYTTAGNFFVWYTQNSSGNEGYFPATYSQSYLTSDNGDVQSVKALDVIGGPGVDLIVGTKSPTANQGQVEIWQSNDAATPTFTRAETYTTWGAGTLMGEVTAMKLVDLDNDGLKDLVVACKTGNYTGQVIYFQNVGKLPLGQRFVYRTAVTMSGLAPTALAASDLDGDGYQDIMVGTQNGTSTGSLIWLKNNGLWGFSTIKIVSAKGIVMSMATAPMGGGYSSNDLIVGWRGNTSDYSGGVTIYYLGVGGVPDNGVDPSGGSIANMVPAVATGNFNYWTYPPGTAPTPQLADLAVGVKTGLTTGQLWVFIR